MDEAKPFDIPQREVWEAFKKVKANQGAAGVDGQSIADFEADLSNNLYKLWTAKRERPKRLQFLLSPDETAAIDDFRYRTRMPSRAAAVRELLRRGLASAKKKPT